MSLHSTAVWYQETITVEARDSYAPDTRIESNDKTWLSIDVHASNDGISVLLSTAQLVLIREAIKTRLFELAIRKAAEVPA